MPLGIDLIFEERSKQVLGKGYTKSHDDEHQRAELSLAALCYINTAIDQMTFPSIAAMLVTSEWPFEREAWKPSDDPIKNLTKAGALIAAEIDRLQRMKS